MQAFSIKCWAFCSQSLYAPSLWLRWKIPEQNFAFHDTELVKILNRKSLLVQNVAQDSTGLLRISLTERLVQRLDELINRGIGTRIEKTRLNQIENYSSFKFFVAFLLRIMMNFKFFNFVISEIDCLKQKGYFHVLSSFWECFNHHQSDGWNQSWRQG